MVFLHANVFPFPRCLSMFVRTCSYCCCCYQVHLCEAEGLAEFLGEGAPLPEQDGRPVLVAVKQLRADATSNARFGEGTHEKQLMGKLHYRVRLLGSSCLKVCKWLCNYVVFYLVGTWIKTNNRQMRSLT